MAAVAVIDIGKSRTRLGVHDAAGHLICRWERDSPALTVGAITMPDLEACEAWLVAHLALAAARAPLTAIVPVAHGAGAVWLNARGEPTFALDYEHPLPAHIQAEHDRDRDRFDQTFSPRLPAGLNLAVQLAFADSIGVTGQWLPLAQYWAMRLAGEPACEVTSLGCHTDLWRPAEGVWSDHARRRGRDRGAPVLRGAHEVLGGAGGALARAAGLDHRIAVHVGAHDSNAAFWGVCAAPALEGRAFTLLSTGTWFVAMRRARDGQCLACLDPERDMLANVDPTGRPVPSARFMGGREMAQIAGSTRIACTLEDLTWAVRSGAMVGPCRTPGTGPFPGGSDAGIGPSPSTPGQAAAIALLHGAAVSAAMIERLSPPGESVVIEGRFAQETRLAGVLAALSPARAIKVVNGPAGPELGALHLAGMGVGGPTLDHAEALALDLSDWHARWLDLAEARQRAIP